MEKRYRHRYSLKEFYFITKQAIRSMGILIQNKHKNYISSEFIERIMLAVTEVNGCEACAYAHAKMALKQGFSQDEINAFLKGDNFYLLPEETKAILFSQYYADSNGRPDKETYETLLIEYGKKKTRVILAAIQMMMLGNVSGLPLSAFLSRLKKNPYSNSSLFYEIGMQLIFIPLFPFAFIHSIISLLYDKTNIKFSANMKK